MAPRERGRNHLRCKGHTNVGLFIRKTILDQSFFSPFYTKDPTNLQRKQLKHSVFESELQANQQRIGKVRDEGNSMISEDHYNSPEIRERLENLNGLWMELLNTSEQKSKSLLIP